MGTVVNGKPGVTEAVNGKAQPYGYTPITYEGILAMFNQCSATKIGYGEAISCNVKCAEIGAGTCIFSLFNNVDTNSLNLAPCNYAVPQTWTADCICCTAPGQSQTQGPGGGSNVCHYVVKGEVVDCIPGLGRWRCDGMCSEGQVR